MTRFILALITVVSFGFASMATADVSTTPAAATGKIVIYRDASKYGASYKVFANTEQLGRIRAGRAIAAELPTGTHTLKTNIKGSDDLNVTTRAGETVYINSRLIKQRSGTFRTVFDAVTEQVAVNSVPAVNDVI